MLGLIIDVKDYNIFQLTNTNIKYPVKWKQFTNILITNYYRFSLTSDKFELESSELKAMTIPQRRLGR